MAAGVISTRLAEWLLVALIVFSLIFEAVLHKIEHWINHKHQHLKAVTWVLYRELMVLGLVSFLFILYETIEKPVGDTVLSFEFAHVFIFLLAIFYTVVLVSAMITSLRMSKRWKEMEQIDLVQYLLSKDKYARYRVDIHRHQGSYWQLFHWWFPNFKKLLEYWRLHELMAFHDIRFQVIYYRNLPEHFRFASFLRRIKAATFLELVDTHWSLWVILLVLVLADILRRYLTRDEITSTSAKFILRAVGDDKAGDVELPRYEPDNAESAFIIVGALILLILCQLLAMKIRHVYWELTKHPRVYYNNVEPAILSEELAAADEKRRTGRNGRLGSADQSYDAGDLADDEGTDFAQGKLNPESEMLDPMNHEPVSGPISVKPKDGLDVKAQDQDGAMSEISAADTHASERGMLRYGTAMRVDGFKKEKSSLSADPSSSMDRIAQPPSRSSLELRRPVRSDLSANIVSDGESRGSLEQPSLQSKGNGIGDAHDVHAAGHALPLEYHETARRHSLDLTRAPAVVATPLATMTSLQPTSVAHAAVNAARRRSLEGNPLAQRTSLEYVPAGGSRSSLELDRDDGNRRRSLNTPRILSHLSSRRGSVDEENSRASLGFRNSLDSGRRSIELARAMPHDEVVERHHATAVDLSDREINLDLDGERSRRRGSLGEARGEKNAKTSETADGDLSHGDDDDTTTRSSRQQNSFLRQKTLAKLNATILRNLEIQEAARNAQPNYYPRIVRKLIPRLDRVASPIEKLFWFGSHKFFLYCVEFTLFFSTVLVAAAFASLSLLLLYDREITGANIASFVLPPITLSFVLLRIAGIIKKYIFIIHNASLVPEAEAIKAIHTATKKGPVVASFDDSEASGDETEAEDREAAREKRRKLGRYFRSEAEGGNIAGIDAEEAIRLSDAGSASQRRAKKRSLLVKLRSRRDPYAESAAKLPV
eukprot:TRINITY_DN1161_c1_g1_i1.p1 TRINITY_DN1161_c1_g1~~TRINITY_DN1161_c1_g1_i1.p1  ORF type:complete len:939 (+),score=138.70 TRINITY_DN1161_c1_g1_i1:423-3239(+)